MTPCGYVAVQAGNLHNGLRVDTPADWGHAAQACGGSRAAGGHAVAVAGPSLWLLYRLQQLRPADLLAYSALSARRMQSFQ